MKYQAIDSFYTSETKQVHAGQEFTADDFGISEARIKEMADKKLIVPANTKAEPAPKNKSEPAPANKSETAPKNK